MRCKFFDSWICLEPYQRKFAFAEGVRAGTSTWTWTPSCYVDHPFCSEGTAQVHCSIGRLFNFVTTLAFGRQVAVGRNLTGPMVWSLDPFVRLDPVVERSDGFLWLRSFSISIQCIGVVVQIQTDCCIHVAGAPALAGTFPIFLGCRILPTELRVNNQSNAAILAYFPRCNSPVQPN